MYNPDDILCSTKTGIGDKYQVRYIKSVDYKYFRGKLILNKAYPNDTLVPGDEWNFEYSNFKLYTDILVNELLTKLDNLKI